jgi:ethanolamine ammonia-lyase small subunit
MDSIPVEPTYSSGLRFPRKGLPRHANAGRRKGTPNRVTARMREQCMATGKTMLQIMTDNARAMDAAVQKLSEQLAKASGDNLIRLMQEILVYRNRAQRYARDAAPF